MLRLGFEGEEAMRQGSFQRPEGPGSRFPLEAPKEPAANTLLLPVGRSVGALTSAAAR